MTLVMVEISDFIFARLYAVHRIVEAQLPELRLVTDWCNADGCYVYGVGRDGEDTATQIVVWDDNWIFAWVGPNGEVGERVRIEDTERLARLFVEGCKAELGI